jgi:cell division septation protein DedD
MKNIHKIRGKREFLFDDKELIALSSGAVIIAGLIFILGFLVGQGVQQRTMASSLSPTDVLAEDTAPMDDPATTALAPEDTSKTEAADTPDKKKSQVGYYRVLPDKGEYVQVEVTPSKSGAIATNPAEQQAQAAAPEVASAPQGKQEPVPPASEQTPAPAASRQAAVLPNVPKSPGDAMYVGRPGTTTAPNGATLVGAGYSVQVASSPRLEESERLQQKFIAAGYDAYIRQANVPDKGIWYRVFVGNFSAKEDAERLRQELLAQASHLTKDPFIAKNTD